MMIIQCKQCKTQFRFDDSLMEGEGLWMRCSRCQHVFFHDNPAKMMPAADLQAEMPAVGPTDQGAAKEIKRPTFEPASRETAAVAQDEDMKTFMTEVMTNEKKQEADISTLAAAPHREEEMRAADIDFSASVDKLEQEQEQEIQEEEMAQQAPPPKKKSKAWMVVLWVILFNVFIFALLYFFAPQVLDTYTQIAQKYIGGGSGATEGQVVMSQVRPQDIRQRIINNVALGNIRVVEGTAVNQADFAVSRIRIKGEIMDAYGVVLGERVSFAGNVLTEEELANMSEDDIQKRLSRPEGRNNINEKVLPNGRIPFMIVFVREKPGVIKTTVVVSGAERLL